MTVRVSIREVSDHFGIPVSTLHYWERRGLVVPHRQANRRHYDQRQVYRIALIQLWRQCGLMSLDEISDLLDVSENWEAILARRVADIDAQLVRLTTARQYLTHLSTCPQGPDLEHCPEFRDRVSAPPALTAGDRS